MSDDVLATLIRGGPCPDCDAVLLEDEPDYDEDTDVLYEIQPVWCPACGWEPA